MSLPPRDLVLVAIVVIAWGSNFTAMKIGLQELPPALFVALRFAILVPLIAIVPRPSAPWSAILAVGLLINTGQFVFLFSAMDGHVSAGLAALLLQAQAPFTILLSVALFGERVTRWQVAGIMVAAVGMAVIGLAGGGSVTALGLGLVLLGALSWACGNLVLKTLPNVAMLPLFVWASIVPPLPMLLLSLVTETQAPLATIAALSPTTWAAVGYVAGISTIVGFSLWGALLARHSAASVTPFALLIPVVGMAVAAIILGERLSGLEALGAVVVFAGLLLAVMRLT
ncbi:MAG: EamA family transporter [Pseudomonadota bacterium]